MKVVDSVENMLEIDNGYLHVVSGTVWYALPSRCKCKAILLCHIPNIRSLQIQTLCSFFLKWQRIPKGLKFPGFSAVYYLDKGCFEKFELEARRSSRRRGRVSTHTQSVLSKIVPPALAREKADADAGCVQCWVLCVDFLPYAVLQSLPRKLDFLQTQGSLGRPCQPRVGEPYPLLLPHAAHLQLFLYRLALEWVLIIDRVHFFGRKEQVEQHARTTPPPPVRRQFRSYILFCTYIWNYRKTIAKCHFRLVIT